MAPAPLRRPVVRYGIGGVVGLLAAAAIAAPAVLLLFQKWAAARMGVGIYDAEFNGNPISVNAVIGWSAALSLPPLLAAAVMLSIAIRNRRKNSHKISGSPTRESLNTAR